MRSPCEALAPMSAYKQFLLYTTRLDPDKPGKNKKFPATTRGEICNAHDPALWVTLDEALAAVQNYPANWGVAFVLAKSDPFFFIDIDACLVNDAWSPLSHSILGAFAGCAVEVSNSGTGLHVIGTGIVPEHGCRNAQFGLEFYTEGRFIALTGTHASGSAGHGARPECLQWLVEQFFPFKGHTQFEGWTTTACEAWNGPDDDADLLRRALASKSAATTFGGRASFADLWTGNIEMLAKSYPPDNSASSAYNASSADSALASLLAFWTGRNCERMERMMRQSALVRAKWDDRDDYLERTILAACGVNKDVLSDKVLEPTVLQAAPPVDEHVVLTSQQEARLIEGSTFATPEQQLEMWKGCVYVRDLNAIFVPHAGGELMSPSTFAAAYGGYAFIMSRENNGLIEKNAFTAFTQSRAVRHLQAASTCFRPLLPPGALVNQDGRDLVNVYMPVTTPRLVGDPAPFIKHLENLLPDPRDRKIFLCYMAACVQYKGVKFQWAPLLQGVEGNGKTAFTRCVAFAIGRKYTHWPKAKKLGAQFNAWMYGNLLYGVEDIYTSRANFDVVEELKPMITGDQLEVEGKGADQVTRDVCGNFMFNSNHKDAVKKTKRDRRFCIFYTPQQDPIDLATSGMDSAYMAHLYRWFKGEGEYAAFGADYGYRIVNELLHTYPIEPEFNPAGDCQRAPTTSTTNEVIAHSRGILEDSVLEAVEEGRPGFIGGFISGYYLRHLFEELRVTLSPTRRTALMRDLGYVLHPTLKDGRVNNIVKPEMSRSVLYVRTDHPTIGRHPSDIAADYEACQIGRPPAHLLTLCQ